MRFCRRIENLFQVLIGILKTFDVLDDPVEAPKFQVLIGILKTPLPFGGVRTQRGVSSPYRYSKNIHLGSLLS